MEYIKSISSSQLIVAPNDNGFEVSGAFLSVELFCLVSARSQCVEFTVGFLCWNLDLSEYKLHFQNRELFQYSTFTRVRYVWASDRLSSSVWLTTNTKEKLFFSTENWNFSVCWNWISGYPVVDRLSPLTLFLNIYFHIQSSWKTTKLMSINCQHMDLLMTHILA